MGYSNITILFGFDYPSQLLTRLAVALWSLHASHYIRTLSVLYTGGGSAAATEAAMRDKSRDSHTAALSARRWQSATACMTHTEEAFSPRHVAAHRSPR